MEEKSEIDNRKEADGDEKSKLELCFGSGNDILVMEEKLVSFREVVQA